MITHPHLEPLKCEGGLFDVEPCEMDLNIGRIGQRIDPDVEKLGTISVEPFQIVGVQKDYRGDKCYRIVYASDAHQLGCVLHPSEPFKLD